MERCEVFAFLGSVRSYGGCEFDIPELSRFDARVVRTNEELKDLHTRIKSRFPTKENEQFDQFMAVPQDIIEKFYGKEIAAASTLAQKAAYRLLLKERHRTTLGKQLIFH